MSGATRLEVCNALWIGKRLGPISHACLRSFVRAGHDVVLHVYDTVEDAPEGVRLSDASAIVPRERIFRHELSGSFALFADYFRCQLQRQGLGLYVDCDVVCVRGIEAGADHVLGFQNKRSINSAVLKLPPDSPILRDMLALFEQRIYAPSWLPLRRRLKQYAKALLGRPADVRHAPWGAAGPQAITNLARIHGLMHLAAPRDVFYPLPYERVAELVDPNVSVDSFVTPQTRCVHLWNDMLRELDPEHAPAGSPIHRLLSGTWPAPAA